MIRLIFILTALLSAIAYGAAQLPATSSGVHYSDGQGGYTSLPPAQQSENQDPVITLTGSSPVSVTEGTSYSSAGATCTDAEDGTISVPAPSYSPAFNINVPGTYVATYSCTDSDSNTVTVNRTVNVNSAPQNSDLAFTNTTVALDNGAGTNIPQVFWAGMPDVNGDGCLDVYIGAHADVVNSNMYVQNNVNGVCQGTFTFFPDTENYSQGTVGQPDEFPRITSRYVWGNWYGHPEGFWSFTGQDVDGSSSARYVLDPSFTTVGGNPQYLTKSGGCFGSRPKCLPVDMDGDGTFEMAYRSFDAPYNTGYVVSASNGNTIYPSNGQNGTFVGSLSVFDVDNDGYPEIVNAGLGGYFTFDSVNSEMDWVGGKFVGSSANAGTTGNHKLPFDYDNDGDLDLYIGEGEYNVSGDLVVHMLQNDGNGNFTDVTSTAFSGITLKTTAYHTTYGNSQIADINLDGWPDIVFGAEEFDDTVRFILNNGDGTFSLNADIETTPQNFGSGNDSSRRPWIQIADYDNDGLPDLIHNGERTGGTLVDGQLYRNTTSTSNHWIQIRIRGAGNNTDGMHSRTTIFEAGTTNIIAHQHIGVFSSGYQNMRVHTGTGSHTLVDVRVEYPHGGPTCDFSNVGVDQNYVAFPSCNLQTYTPGSAIPLTYVATNNVNTTVQLVADSVITPTNSEQVTFAIPFAEGDVADVSELKISIAGSEVAAAVDEIVSYQGSKIGVRSARIQIPSVDMTSGTVTVSITDEGASVARVPFSDQSVEFATAAANKASMPFKRVWAQHNLAYVAVAGLIPPYATGADLDAAYATYAEHQFDNWASGFDYSASSQSNWLFDRAGALYKLYLQFGDTKYLKEAFLAFRYYISNIQMTGTVASGRGGWIGDTVDDKYAYAEAVLIHYALTGDDTWLPGGDSVNAVVTDMALRALDHSEQGYIYTSLFSNGPGYESEREFFTERRTGLTLWGAAVACSMTGDATLCNRVDDFILDLKEHQQGVDNFDIANGWDTKTGAFVHSWLVHECGGCFSGNESNVPLGSDPDRRFSPWMSSNIQLALWTAYWTLDSTLLTNRSELPEIIRFLADGVHNYGLDPSPIGASSNSHGFAAYTNTRAGYTYGSMSFCDATDSSPFVLYTAAPYATQAELFDPIPYSGGAAGSMDYPDNRASTHYGEVMGLLAAGLYFETDSAKRSALETTIANLSDVYTTACSSWFAGSGVPRAFNWQFFTNPRATYDWARQQS